jgi:hypothetical protein
MPIKLPIQRAYYAASPTEPEQLLCWIPKEEVQTLIQKGEASAELLDAYPLGLEVEVSERAFGQLGLTLPAPSADLARAFADLREHGRLPPSGYVDGTYLERNANAHDTLATAAADMIAVPEGQLPLGFAPEPAMSSGEAPSDVLNRLAGSE